MVQPCTTTIHSTSCLPHNHALVTLKHVLVTDSNVFVLLLSLRAGGVGLNLQVCLCCLCMLCM